MGNAVFSSTSYERQNEDLWIIIGLYRCEFIDVSSEQSSYFYC